MTARRLLPLLLLMTGIPFQGMAQGATASSSTQDSTTVELTADEQQQARQWQLTATEWLKYKTLKAGPRGIWSPQLDPLTTLGVSATDDQTRRRYAELLVHQELRRVEGEIAFQKAYDEAFARMTPGVLPIVHGPAAPASDQRLALFVGPDCPRCDTVVQDLIRQGRHLDIYRVATQGDDRKIRAWAESIGIPAQKVRSRAITLNHDQGRWFRLTGMAGVLPGAYTQEAGQWRPVPL